MPKDRSRGSNSVLSALLQPLTDYLRLLNLLDYKRIGTLAVQGDLNLSNIVVYAFSAVVITNLIEYALPVQMKISDIAPTNIPYVGDLIVVCGLMALYAALSVPFHLLLKLFRGSGLFSETVAIYAAVSLATLPLLTALDGVLALLNVSDEMAMRIISNGQLGTLPALLYASASIHGIPMWRVVTAFIIYCVALIAAVIYVISTFGLAS